jgi:hypothetical protein
MDDKREKLSEINSALDSCGIGHDVDGQFHEQFAEIATFCADLQKRACQQAAYNLLRNVPLGILTRDETKGHAIRSAIAGAVGALVEWSIDGALEIAGDIAEEVNAHAEAKQIRAMIVADAASVS